MKLKIIAVLMLTATALASAYAYAQTLDPGMAAIGWVCSNQTLVAWALSALIAHTGLSITSATLKKLGAASDSPWVKIIRMLAIDVKPQAAQIVEQAAVILASQPAAAQAGGANPTNVAAAAEAMKIQAKG